MTPRLDMPPPHALSGAGTLFYKEVLRFRKVSVQTVGAPVLTAVLYLLIFGHVLEGRMATVSGVGYGSFLIPGLVMMSVLQNSFANASSSLIQSKISGNLVFVLVAPLSHWGWFLAYVGAAVVFTLMGSVIMGALGLIAGLWAEKFDQIATFQNFVVMPMTFLAGVFYSVQGLPEIWQRVSHLNPLFYLVDGFRYGFFGTSDVAPWLSASIAGIGVIVVCAVSLHLLRIGYKIRQ